MDSPESSEPSSSADSSISPAPSLKNIGPYRLVRKLGEGGMGQVWLAEQTAPLQRLVAIKLIRSGVSDEALLDRFESERQALARMSHPAIAKVYDAGTTPEGTPYFVMEYVPGIPITRYCDEKRLSIRQRLELFLKVCDGVQHAHQKAILHRDLKPANILVTETDGKPAPHIIDFGIAKSIAARDPLATMFTRAGHFVGTPMYMSPEQADPDVLDVDTRSDVYSLAVVLYELLTGALPFDPTQWRNQILQESLRKIFEQEPPLPSTQFRKKITTDTDTAAKTASMRSTAPRELVTQLTGDLDWITLKALERDRTRRYGTPIEFAADLQRYLNHEPVSARPASVAYRFSKYVRRHRLGVSVAAAGLLILIAFSVAQAIEIRRVTEERDRTARERDRANRIADFMTRMFKVSDPSEARGNSITAREVLDKASKDIDTSLAKDPDMQAQMMNTMGSVYMSLGLYKDADSLFRHALDARTRLFGPNNRDTILTALNLSEALMYETQLPDSEKYVRQAYDSARSSLGPSDPLTIRTGNALGLLLNNQGRFADSETVLRQTAEDVKLVKDSDTQSELSRLVQSNLAINLAYQGKYVEAEKSFRALYDLTLKKFGPDHPSTINAKGNIGNILLQQNKYPEAEAIYKEVIEANKRVLGPEHPRTLLIMGNLGLAYLNEKRYPEAEALYRQLLDLKTRILGPNDRQTLVVKGALADTLYFETKSQEAEKVARETLEAERRVLGPEHSDTLVTENSLGLILEQEHRYPESETVMKDTLALRTKVLGAKHADTSESEYNLAGLYALMGKKDEAFHYLDRSLEDHPKNDLYENLAVDPNYKSLHSDPRFAAFLSRSKSLAPASP
jgi:non-specific serine/threonine protein kinase/serine/threonine-protein kinase